MRSRQYRCRRAIGLSSFAAGDRLSFSQAASARASMASRSTRPSELEDGATIMTPMEQRRTLGQQRYRGFINSGEAYRGAGDHPSASTATRHRRGGPPERRRLAERDLEGVFANQQPGALEEFQPVIRDRTDESETDDCGPLAPRTAERPAGPCQRA